MKTLMLRPIAQPVPVVHPSAKTRPAFRLSLAPKSMDGLMPTGFIFLGHVTSGTDKKWWTALEEASGETIMAETARGLLESVMKKRHAKVYDRFGRFVGDRR